jgi:serine/threonine protein kinase
MVNIEREITFHQKIDHPNIIRFYDYQKNDEQKKVLIALEYAEQGDLFNFLNKKGALEEKMACKFFVQTALALNYIHQFKMIHRDVKPENILLDKSLNAKLCDFGWSAEYDENTKRQTICGTYEYMAPEIIFKKQQDTSIDIWALGILLFELLHNKAPYSGRSMMEVSKKIASKQIEFSSQIAQDAKELILRILKTNPKDRPSIPDILLDPFVQRTYGQMDQTIFTQGEKRDSQKHPSNPVAETPIFKSSSSSQVIQNNTASELPSPLTPSSMKRPFEEKPKPAPTHTSTSTTPTPFHLATKRPPLGPQLATFSKQPTIPSTPIVQSGRSILMSGSPSNEQRTVFNFQNLSSHQEPSHHQAAPSHFSFEKTQEAKNQGQYMKGITTMTNNHDKHTSSVPNTPISNGSTSRTYHIPSQPKLMMNFGSKHELTEKQIQKENGGNSFSTHSQPIQTDRNKALQPLDCNSPPARQYLVVEDSNKSNANLKLNTLRLKKVISDQPFMKPPVNTKDTGLKSFMGIPNMIQNQPTDRVNSSYGGPSDSYRSIRKQNSLDVDRVVVQQGQPQINFYRPLTGQNSQLTR